MATPLKIELELDIDKHLAQHLGYDADGEPATGPMTLEDLVLDLTAARLAQQAINGQKNAAWDSIGDRVKNITSEEIRSRVAPLIEEAMAQPIRKTNTYGEPVGAETTLREIIIAEAQAFLTKTGDRYSNKGTVVQEYIRQEVGLVLKKELDGVMAQAKADVLAAVKNQAATVIEQTIARLAGVK